jgi:hypothetical protein
MPRPAVVQAVGDTIVEVNEVIDYSIVPVPFASYEWTVNGGTIIEGHGSATVKVKWAATPLVGQVNVVVRIGNTCRQDMLPLAVRVGTVGTSVREQESGFLNIYPNPSSQSVFVNMELNEADVLDIIIYNNIGAAIYRREIPDRASKHFIELQRENFGAAGVYYLSAFTSKGIITKPIIIIQ